MAQYIAPVNQSLLWDTLHNSNLFVRVFPQPLDQSNWFQEIIQGIYKQQLGGRPISLSQTVLEKYNRDTILYMLQDLQKRSRAPVHTQGSARAPVHTQGSARAPVHTGPIPVADLRKPPSGIELRLAEHQRDLDHYLGEKRPTEIDFRMDMVDTPLDTTDIEALLKQQKEQRATMEGIPEATNNGAEGIYSYFDGRPKGVQRNMDELSPPVLVSSVNHSLNPSVTMSNTFVDDLQKRIEDNHRYIREITQSHNDAKKQLDDLQSRLERLEHIQKRVYDSDSDSPSKQMDGYNDDITQTGVI
jgi:hypothetical protein